MFDLIEAAEQYPQFLPWCTGATIVSRDDDLVAPTCACAGRRALRDAHAQPQAAAGAHGHPPRARAVPPLRRGVALRALGEDACKVDFTLDYEFDQRAGDASPARCSTAWPTRWSTPSSSSGEQLVGLTHYLYHRSTTRLELTCYLQDLFTAPEHRGRGIGRALIEGVCVRAKVDGIRRVYWQTHESNSTGRRLYDQVARHHGFIVYARDVA
jgi:GNAT superfamily N-acetyltransferase